MSDPSAHRREARGRGRPPRTSLGDLVAAALDLGLDTFTMRDVAAHVGVGLSTAYTYVESREHLYAEASSSAFVGLDVTGDHATWTAYVDEICERAVALARAHPGIAGYLLAGPYTAGTVAVFDAIIARVRVLLADIAVPEHVAWVLASGPFSISVAYLGDPVLEPMSPWIRAALIEGLDAKLRAGTLPAEPTIPWRTKLGEPDGGASTRS